MQQGPLQVRTEERLHVLSSDFRQKLECLGMTPLPAFVRQPEGNGCIEGLFRTLKERLLWVRQLRSGLQLDYTQPGVQHSWAGTLRSLRRGTRTAVRSGPAHVR